MRGWRGVGTLGKCLYRKILKFRGISNFHPECRMIGVLLHSNTCLDFFNSQYGLSYFYSLLSRLSMQQENKSILRHLSNEFYGLLTTFLKDNYHDYKTAE